MSNPPKIIAVVGQTASGKTSLAVEISKKYNGEVICADSRTIYKDFNIGTAKPTKEEQEGIAHYLLDVANPGDNFSAALFTKMALEKIKEISQKGKLPVVVGGTGLYVDSILFDYQFSKKEPADQERRRLESLSVEELQQILRENEIPFPENEKNKRYLVRTIERGNAYPDDRKQMRENTLVIGLDISKSQLRSRIEKRVELMFRRGLRREVEDLIAKYGQENEALTGIGYREFIPYFEEGASMMSVKQKIIQDTLQFAKRQKTWFKRNRNIIWCSSKEEVLQKVDAFLKSTDYNKK